MTVTIQVDNTDPTPPFEQIRAQLADLITIGSLHPGDRLPTVRQLAGDLRVANGTVARAYKELEAGGLVVARRAGGTRVADTASLTRPQPREQLQELARVTVQRGRALGFNDDDITAALAAALRN